MKFTLEIAMDNAAFSDDQGAHELALVLTLVAAKIPDHPAAGDSGKVRDTNGNTVGAWQVTA